jgi:hypothetical protein
MTKPRISDPAKLAEVDRLLEETAERRAEIAREQQAREIEESVDVDKSEHVRRTGLMPPDQQ